MPDALFQEDTNETSRQKKSCHNVRISTRIQCHGSIISPLALYLKSGSGGTLNRGSRLFKIECSVVAAKRKRGYGNYPQPLDFTGEPCRDRTDNLLIKRK